MSGFAQRDELTVEDIVSTGRVAPHSNYESLLSFEMNAHAILVEVLLNGHEFPFTFILDTGAMSVIDRRAADLVKPPELDLDIPAHQETEMQIIALESVSMGGMEVNDLVMRKGDLSLLEDISGIPIHGILGSDFLRFFKIEIDYTNQVFFISQDTDPIDEVDGTYYFPIMNDPNKGYVPEFPIQVGDMVVSAIIDTGASGMLVIPETVLSDLDVEEDEVVESFGQLAAGMFSQTDSLFFTELEDLRIGRLLIPELGATTRDIDHALIGYGILRNFVVTINYPENEMLFKPVGVTSFSGNLASVGLRVFMDTDGDMIISGFWEDSPAYESDLEIGDEILMVDTQPVNGMSIIEVNNLFKKEEGKQLRVFALSDEGIKEVWLYTQDLIPEEENAQILIPNRTP